MRVLQQYYTSYCNEETGSMGFQVKAASPGISASLETQIARLIGYRIPPSLDEQDIASHPVALRYFYIGADQSILLCSQSSGKDVNGRPGNFFAHTLVIEPEIFTSTPPIFYWKSPFWCHEDSESASTKTSLPILENFEIDPSLDIEDVWNFLAQGERRVMLNKLLCAVVHYKKTHRRIVILDSTENVAYWIAAVSCLLPPAYRPMLSFATYHHEPQQGHYLITGTTSDSSFRATPENYASYFILNAETGITSAVPASSYARMAADAAQPDLYESQLLVMFTDYARRFPTPTSIDEQLDLLALYTKIQFQAPRNEAALEDGELQAIHVALSSFEELRELTQEDIDELHRLQQILLQAAQVQQNLQMQRENGRIAALLKTREKENETLNEDQQKVFIERLLQDIASEGEQGRLAVIERRVKHVKQLGYNSEFIVSAGLNRLQQMSSPRSWQEFAPQILKNSLFAPLPQKLEEELIHVALSIVLLSDAAFSNIAFYTRYQNHPALSEDAKKTIAAILAIASGRMNGALAQHVNRKVMMLLPEEYRSVIKRCMHEFFQHDVTDQAHGNLIVALFTRNHGYATFFWQTYWEIFAQLVISPQFRDRVLAMLSFWFKVLPAAFPHPYIVQDYFLRLHAALANLQQNESCRLELREFSSTVAQQHWYATVQSYFPVKKGILEPIGQGLVSLFQRPAANQQTDKQYEAEIESLFTGNPAAEHRAHAPTLYGREQFWAFYWPRFKDAMMTSEAQLISELLSFWFDEAFATPRYVSYAPQEFYLGLSGVLESAHKEQGFDDIGHQIDEHIMQQNQDRYRWYPLIRKYFTK